MEVWILFNDEIESPTAEAFEIRRFLAEGKNMDINVKVFRPEQFDLLVSEDERDSILVDGQLMSLPDVMMPRTLVEESGYFSLAVIRHMKRLGVIIYNDATSIEIVADKMHSHQILSENNLPTPITMLAKFPVDIDLVDNFIGFPVVVKTLLGANGSGVFLVESQDAFRDLMDLIEETSPNIQLIFQQYIAASRGRDLRLFVVDGVVIGSMERKAADGGFKANYSTGGTVEKFVPDEEAIHLAVKTAEILNIPKKYILIKNIIFLPLGHQIL